MLNSFRGAFTSFALLLVKTEQLHSQTKLSISFDVQPGINHTVVIQCNSKLEIDSFNYVIEKSTDKQTWQTIAETTPQSLHGYSSVDYHPAEGLNYYRLKQTKSNGKVLFTEIEWLQIGNAGKLYIWPNPANDILHVKASFVKASMSIVDAEGKFIFKISIINFITDVPTSRLYKGIYFLHVRHNNEIYVEKFVKD